MLKKEMVNVIIEKMKTAERYRDHLGWKAGFNLQCQLDECSKIVSRNDRGVAQSHDKITLEILMDALIHFLNYNQDMDHAEAIKENELQTAYKMMDQIESQTIIMYLDGVPHLDGGTTSAKYEFENKLAAFAQLQRFEFEWESAQMFSKHDKTLIMELNPLELKVAETLSALNQQKEDLEDLEDKMEVDQIRKDEAAASLEDPAPVQDRIICDFCKGSGETDDHICEECDGKGSLGFKDPEDTWEDQLQGMNKKQLRDEAMFFVRFVGRNGMELGMAMGIDWSTTIYKTAPDLWDIHLELIELEKKILRVRESNTDLIHHCHRARDLAEHQARRTWELIGKTGSELHTDPAQFTPKARKFQERVLQFYDEVVERVKGDHQQRHEYNKNLEEIETDEVELFFKLAKTNGHNISAREQLDWTGKTADHINVRILQMAGIVVHVEDRSGITYPINVKKLTDWILTDSSDPFVNPFIHDSHELTDEEQELLDQEDLMDRPRRKEDDEGYFVDLPDPDPRTEDIEAAAAALRAAEDKLMESMHYLKKLRESVHQANVMAKMEDIKQIREILEDPECTS